MLFKHPRLPSVRNRILLFAVLVTLLPSIGLGWVYFNQAEKALIESSQREMLGTVGQVRREFGLWFKERYHDIRVLSGSYMLSEGLENYLAMRGQGAEEDASDGGTQLAKMESYLSLVHSEFRDYGRLLIFDSEARLLTQSPKRAGFVDLPDDWRDQMETKKFILGEVDEAQRETPSMLAAVPVLSGDGTMLGLLAAEVKLDALEKIMLASLAKEDFRTSSADLLLVGRDGKILLSTDSQPGATRQGGAYEQALPPNELGEYTNDQGVPVVGIMSPVSAFAWSIVMEKGRKQVLAEVMNLRTKAMLVVGVLVTLTGLFAYLLSRGIVSPLERLTQAAGEVADGDLDVHIPVKSDDELGTATQVFNDMVQQLRQSRRRLEELSTMDSLTQLSNRRHILEKLADHLARYHRNGTPFSVLLVDADHFKHINDSAGHVVGDKVLRELGATFKRVLRTVDSAGRYGGEEFLIILDQTRGKEALLTADRIRLTVESAGLADEEAITRFTVSIGVAEISAGETEDQLIMRADTALYQAKREGRNRSVLAELPSGNITQHPAVRKLDPS